MINLGMSIFDLAEIQILKELRAGHRFKNLSLAILDRAIKIRKWLDIQERNKKVAKNRYSK